MGSARARPGKDSFMRLHAGERAFHTHLAVKFRRLRLAKRNPYRAVDNRTAATLFTVKSSKV